MKQFLSIIAILFLFSGCSIMQKQMMKKMSKMSEEEKIEMMSQMMRSTDSASCNDMMGRMSAVFSNDSLAKDEMAAQMLPVCVGGILSEVKEDKRAEYLLNLTMEILYSGYDDLPENDRQAFKTALLSSIEKL